MKIKADVLLTFLKKVTVNNSVSEGIFDFSETGLKTIVTTMDTVTNITAILNAKAFSVYEPVGKVALNDLKTLLLLLGKFKGEIEILTTTNTITFKDTNKQVETITMDLQFVVAPKTFSEEKLKQLAENFNNSFNIPLATYKEFIETANVNKDFDMYIKTGENAVMLSTDGKYKVSSTFKADAVAPGTSQLFGTPFIDAVSSLDHDFNISMSNIAGFPVKIVENTDVSNIVIITVPKVLTE